LRRCDGDNTCNSESGLLHGRVQSRPAKILFAFVRGRVYAGALLCALARARRNYGVDVYVDAVCSFMQSAVTPSLLRMASWSRDCTAYTKCAALLGRLQVVGTKPIDAWLRCRLPHV
jgi:hypothetical protein